MTDKNKQKFLKNLLKFFAPGLAVVFAQLQMGASLQVALTSATLVMYGVISDYLSKLK